MASAIPRDFIFNASIGSRPLFPAQLKAPAPLACTGTFRKHNTTGAIYSAYPFSAVGKVYFSLGTDNYVCSGSIGDKRVIWTAGHCTYDSATGFAKNFMFIPGYWDRNEPFGRFAAQSLCAAKGWQDGNIAYDYAIARLPADNPLPTDSTGILPVVVDLNPEVVDYVSYGYPQGPPFDGAWENTCAGKLCVRDWWVSPQAVSIACDSTGGSSGGPWMRNGNSIVGLNSYQYFFQPNQMYGPYFNKDTMDFFNRNNPGS